MNCTERECNNVSSEDIPIYTTFTKRLTIAIAVLLIIFMPLIILVNSLVILSVVVFKRLRRYTNYLLCSLAFADLLVGMVTFPFYILFYMGPESLHYNRDLCLSWFGSVILGCGASLYNLLLLVVDRFIAIAYPIFHLKLKSSSIVYLIGLLGLWIYIIVLSALPLMGWNNFVENRYCAFYTTLPKVYVFWALYGTVGICIIVSSLLYVKIFMIVRQHKFQIRSLSQSTTLTGKKAHSPRAANFAKNAKFTKFSSIIFLIFVIFWTPFFIMIPLKYSSLPYDSVESVTNLTLLLAFVNSVVNPIAYVYIRQDFRFACQLLLRTPFWRWSDMMWHTLGGITVASSSKFEYRSDSNAQYSSQMRRYGGSRNIRSANTDYENESFTTVL